MRFPAGRAPDESSAAIRRESAYRFMWKMAGNLPDFEKASREIHCKAYYWFDKLISDWPEDIRTHVGRLVERVQETQAALERDRQAG